MHHVKFIGVPYYSEITIGHLDSPIFLHSHRHNIPLKHKDGRISSQGQQVNGINSPTNESFWQIIPCDINKAENDFKSAIENFQKIPSEEKEISRNVRYLRLGDYIQLFHKSTDSFLRTHDVASPLTQTNMEVTTVSPNLVGTDKNAYEETLWKVTASDRADGSILQSKKQGFKLISVAHNVALYSTKSGKIPAWGFGMQEINGNKDIDQKYGNSWTIQEIRHERYVDSI